MKYKPTKFMAEGSHYDKATADYVVSFINQLSHTKGKWAGKKFDLLPWQEQIIRDVFGILKEDGTRQFRTAYIEISKKNGKLLALDTPIPTPDGYTAMGDIKVGDMVFDEKGKPCHVVAKSEIDHDEQAYLITFRDGEQITAGENHQWLGEYTYGKKKQEIFTTGEIYRNCWDNNRGVYLFRLKVAEPLEYPEATDLPIEPYLMGYWLGNGNAIKPEITIFTPDVPEVTANIFPYHKESGHWRNVGDSMIYRFPDLSSILLKSFHDKHIPDKYMRASKAQRLRLLQGLMDSDGCISKKKGQAIYCSTEKGLAEDVSQLVWSLGFKNTITRAACTQRSDWSKSSAECGRIFTGETMYMVKFTAFNDVKICGLKRKQRRTAERNPRSRSQFRYIKSIEPVENKGMQCIQVDSPSHQYLAGRSFVPTHNSELAAAVALYLLFGDGEPSAEVYGAAADRQQASIVFDVANQMVKMSPALMRRSKILTANKRIVNYDNNGFYQVLSADVGTKHGLNVSGLVFDEVHVQPNRKLYDVLTQGSGDAREQPLYFLITTAGNDVNSICYELHEKALDIMEGRKIDPTFYPVIYGAGMDEDWTDPKVWKKANPSLGHTIKLESIAAACESAKQNPAEENAFRQLRLDQWVKQSIRWMPMQKWDACAFPVDERSLEGRVCYGGLDLSQTTDITAFVLVFPPRNDTEKYIVLPYFWIPEENVPLRVNRDHVPYDVWAREGYLNLTEGNVIHYAEVERFIEELGNKYHIKEIAFDRWGAAQMVQNLQDKDFTVVQFGQGYKDMSPPTKELMNLTLEQRIAHGGHPVLRWMMDNVYVKEDSAGNIKMDKEKSTEKIDGAVAMVMALDRAIRCGADEGDSIYNHRGMIFI